MANTIQHWSVMQQPEQVLMVGIHQGGVWVAQHLHRLLDLPQPLGQLNIAFYRDDFSKMGLHPHVGASELPEDVTDKHIILVDDVLYSGRTIRAALNELFDYGRPASVRLAVLAQRTGRELPIAADVVGVQVDLTPQQYLQLDGAQLTQFSICER
jgi:pyrimidine operon attenuation protein/uracil phosphoribosyltransferase